VNIKHIKASVTNKKQPFGEKTTFMIQIFNVRTNIWCKLVNNNRNKISVKKKFINIFGRNQDILIVKQKPSTNQQLLF